jgi:DNA polymerase-3 subunit beta
MEFTITRTEMLAGLYLTQGIVERRTTIPILGNVLIQSSGDGVLMSATDQEVSVRRRCTATVKRKGSLTTGARKLYEMVRELPEGDLKVHSLDNYWIEVSAGRSRFRLVGLDPREFPAMTELEAGKEREALRLSVPTLSEMIERTIFAVSDDETRMNLNGIYLECLGTNRLRIVATDGHRLAMVTRPVDGAELKTGVIVPRKGVMELRKVLESGDEAVELCLQGGLVHAIHGPVQMSVRLVEGEFPDYQQVIPSKTKHSLSVEVESLLAAVRRVSIVSSERTRGVKMQIEGQKMTLSSINPDVGEAADELEMEYDGEPMSIGFNARYLMDGLAVLPQDGRVEIALIDEISPGIVRDPSDADYCYIVMPMRL